MVIRDLKGKVNDLIPINTVLLSVSDKSGLDVLVPELVEINQSVRLISTGGTYTAVEKILGENASRNLMDVSEYTGFPEMEGGLVKTLHPKVHAGLLAERNNPEHQAYLSRMGGKYIDLVVVNLYPFSDVVKKIEDGEINPKTGKPYDFESARGNIDIGGPTMLRAGAKNFPSCAVLCDPEDYPNFLKSVRDSNCTSFARRFMYAKKVFKITGEYDSDISKYVGESAVHKVRQLYEFSEGE
ncbi:hypothetical protein GOV12_02455 [Candidatus Pacearchaeota archaeon]|nr:hypothetical protein [Candidatus Pacearchaeota archaeon]